MIKPRFSCSTAEIFSHFNLKEKDPILCPNQENITQWKDKLINDLEEVAFNLHPELHIIKNYLYSLGAIYASMTGSGSVLYGVFGK